MKYTTTKKQYKYFIARCEYWKHLLCIDYDIVYDHLKRKTTLAETSYEVSPHIACIRLATIFDTSPSNKLLDRIALHEICHLLFGEITDLATIFYATKYIEAVEHGIIARLENIVERD